ncbi:uncharacterized protein LOC141657855 [Silene latifolia]|uniref:uncharacterized protein LOC141657855 n=1 Tax=Silene latifolia TaxID=37657 RepID=UPI003D77D01D
MNSIQNHKQNFDQSLSFEDVSKLFPLPLSEAADILGVSSSVLKRLCNENGLERWPHRKYLAGKTIEEIKKEAIKEKSKALGGNSQADKHKSNGTTARSTPELSKPQGNAGKTTWRPHQTLAPVLPLEVSIFTEEFKYGFPSNGLSRSTNKWWGSGCGNNGSSKDEAKTTLDVKDALESQVEKVSLAAIRKRALDEGQKALASGALKKHGADQLEKEEQILLRRLFQSS